MTTENKKSCVKMHITIRWTFNSAKTEDTDVPNRVITIIGI